VLFAFVVSDLVSSVLRQEIGWEEVSEFEMTYFVLIGMYNLNAVNLNATTPRAIKRRQLIFVCYVVKSQRILMQFSPLGFKMNDTREGMNFAHLT